jgi:hypothetical protein
MILRAHPKATQEYVSAIDWHVEERDEATARHFVECVESRYTKLREERVHSNVVVGVAQELGTRRVIVPDFEYQVIFIERATFRAVLAVAHFRQEPGYWLDRLKDYPAP